MSAARRYHEATSHYRDRLVGGTMDRSNRPRPFKEYAGVPREPLPDDALGRVLRHGARVLREYPTHHFRAYSSAGALYPLELYAATPTGLHHFDPRELTLARLRDDVRANIAQAAAAPELADAEAVVVVTGILWRTAWKYGERGYRHLWWDAGTMLAGLLELAAAHAPRVYVGFVDAELDDIVGVAPPTERTLALFAFGRATRAVGRAPLAQLPNAEPVGARPQTFREAELFHAQSSLASADDVGAFRRPNGDSPGTVPDDEALEAALRRRGSYREFSHEPLPRDELADVLAHAAAPIPADVQPWTRAHIVVSAVDGLERGLYAYAPPNEFHLVRGERETRALAQHLVLGQELGHDAAALVFFTANLDDVLAAHGDRGYRAVQLEAGVRVGRVYLDATTRGWGVTATTFFDADTSHAFETEEAPMLAVAVGRR